MIDKTMVTRHFSQMAPSYDSYAVVQRQMGDVLLQEAAQRAPHAAILEIGCGTGAFTRQLAATFPTARLLATDIAPGMLQTARQQLCAWPHIEYAQADGEQLALSRQFSLIISNAAFQWFNQPQQAWERLTTHLRPGGWLLFATFGEHTFQELHHSFQAAYQRLGQPPQRHGQTFLTADAIAALSQANGLAGYCQETNYRYTFPSVRDFLRSVKRVGAGNACADASRPPQRALMQQMLHCYAERFADASGVQATYHVLFGLYQKPV